MPHSIFYVTDVSIIMTAALISHMMVMMMAMVVVAMVMMMAMTMAVAFTVRMTMANPMIMRLMHRYSAASLY